MSDLERAEKFFGCSEGAAEDRDYSGRVIGMFAYCTEHGEDEWPCPEATRLAALLAETRADELERVADSLEGDARRLSSKANPDRKVILHGLVHRLRRYAADHRSTP